MTITVRPGAPLWRAYIFLADWHSKKVFFRCQGLPAIVKNEVFPCGKGRGGVTIWEKKEWAAPGIPIETGAAVKFNKNLSGVFRPSALAEWVRPQQA